MCIIDFHTHAFPDAIAERAIPALEQESSVKAILDGKIGSLLAAMDAAGIAQSVVCSIATRPEQFAPIVQWSRQIASPRLLPFPSIHPDDPDAAERVREVHAAGFLGLKLHPYYQTFAIDEPRLYPLYEAIAQCGLVCLMHAGFDPAFPREDRCAEPVRIRRVLEAFPALKLVAAHMGAWDDWDEVRAHLLGKPVYMDIAFLLETMPRAQARAFLLEHPGEYVLFGTDSPWTDPRDVIANVRALELGPRLEEMIFYKNAEALLGSVPA